MAATTLHSGPCLYSDFCYRGEKGITYSHIHNFSVLQKETRAENAVTAECTVVQWKRGDVSSDASNAPHGWRSRPRGQKTGGPCGHQIPWRWYSSPRLPHHIGALWAVARCAGGVRHLPPQASSNSAAAGRCALPCLRAQKSEPHARSTRGCRQTLQFTYPQPKQHPVSYHTPIRCQA